LSIIFEEEEEKKEHGWLSLNTSTILNCKNNIVEQTFSLYTYYTKDVSDSIFGHLGGVVGLYLAPVSGILNTTMDSADYQNIMSVLKQCSNQFGN